MRRLFLGLGATTIAAIAVIACSGGGGGEVSGDGGGASSSSGAATCTGTPAAKTCEGAPCGGDIVGTWKLVTFCGPRCVSSLAPSVTYGADGKYQGGGTWKYGADNTVTTTVGNASSTASYCVSGDTLWINRGTNCGPTDPGSVRSLWQRDCGGGAPQSEDAGRAFDGAF